MYGSTRDPKQHPKSWGKCGFHNMSPLKKRGFALSLRHQQDCGCFLMVVPSPTAVWTRRWRIWWRGGLQRTSTERKDATLRPQQRWSGWRKSPGRRWTPSAGARQQDKRERRGCSADLAMIQGTQLDFPTGWDESAPHRGGRGKKKQTVVWESANIALCEHWADTHCQIFLFALKRPLETQGFNFQYR